MMEVGDQAKFVFEENASTGYHWVFDAPSVDADLLLGQIYRTVRNDYTQDTSSGLLGAPGKRTLVIEALQKGALPISGVYMPPGSSDVYNATYNATAEVLDQYAINLKVYGAF